jgi:hypothetical protein
MRNQRRADNPVTTTVVNNNHAGANGNANSQHANQQVSRAFF